LELILGGSAESCCDDINVFNGSGDLLGSYAGTINETIVSDDVIVIQIISDGSIAADYGYGITWSINCIGNDFGCTDEIACNYDSDASFDDGSCEFAEEGYDCNGNCLETFTIVVECLCLENENVVFTTELDQSTCTTTEDCYCECINDLDGDGICDEDEVGACTDPLAYNYDSLADEDDGSCLYLGCIEITACNYDLSADIDDGSCVFPDETYLDCDGDCINDLDSDAICDELEIFGCTDPQADNFNLESTQEDGSCFYLGCTDETACNYDSNANVDDGSCTYPYETYLNCDWTCINDTDGDGVCDEQEIAGCTEDTACNYDPNATEDDDLCTYPETGFDCDGNCSDDDADGLPDDFDGDGICDYIDNCFYDFNPGQEDLDGDDEGDVCDSDDGLSLNEQVEHSLLVFPNPTNDIVNIEYLSKRNDVLILKIMNTIGQIIEVVELNTIDSYINYSVDIASFGKGIYQIYLLDGEKVIVRKVFLN
ncbi:MAG: hypothetical protein CMP68_04555, partial [Flavobacteriales bacterium]|nr:hypothetical protein [Flavobacteriales bacterium]